MVRFMLVPALMVSSSFAMNSGNVPPRSDLQNNRVGLIVSLGGIRKHILPAHARRTFPAQSSFRTVVMERGLSPFDSAINALPSYLKTDLFKSEYGKLDKKFQTVQLIQSLSKFSQISANDVLNLIIDLNELPEEFSVNHVIRFVNLVHDSFKDDESRGDYLYEGIGLLIYGESYRDVHNYINEQAY